MSHSPKVLVGPSPLLELAPEYIGHCKERPLNGSQSLPFQSRESGGNSMRSGCSGSSRSISSGVLKKSEFPSCGHSVFHWISRNLCYFYFSPCQEVKCERSLGVFQEDPVPSSLCIMSSGCSPFLLPCPQFPGLTKETFEAVFSITQRRGLEE